MEKHVETLVTGPSGTTSERKAYKKHYNRGWRSSAGPYASLDRGDSNNEPDAWYDGYLDLACGRAKWHSITHWESDPCLTCGFPKCHDCDWLKQCSC